MKNILIGFVLVFYTCVASAQLATGTWETHFSYKQGRSLTIADDKVYVVGSGFLFSYGLNDNAVQTYSKLNGLNDVEISLVRYYNDRKLLFIGYVNGNIDLLVDSKIINIQDIKLASINGSKRINNVTFYENTAYISMDLGVVVLNLDRNEIKETYTLNSGIGNNAVNGVAILNGWIYAATDMGLYKCNLSNQQILNFANWDYETAFPEYNKRYAEVKLYNTHLIAVRADDAQSNYKLYAYKNNILYTIQTTGTRFRNLQVNNNLFVLCSFGALYKYNESLSLKGAYGKYQINTFSYAGHESMYCNDVASLDDETFFVADNRYGLVKFTVNNPSEVLLPSGPAQNTPWAMNVSEGGLRVVHGKLTSSWNNTSTPAELSVFKNNNWQIIDKNNTPELAGVIDFVDLITDPVDEEHFFVASYKFGLYEFKGIEFLNRYYDANSTLENISSTSTYFRIHGLAFDAEGSLWLNNNEVFNSIQKYDSEGNWWGLNFSPIDNAGADKKFSLGEMIVAENGDKWMVVPRNGGGIFVFNDNGTPGIKSDDTYKMLYPQLDTDEKEFANNVNCIVQDKDGAIWFGTENGIGVYYSTDNVLENNDLILPARIKVPRKNDSDKGADWLLDSETINDIVVDGGNRKWIGTGGSGVLLVSPDGITTIAHFTTQNSPLPSNSISSLALDPKTGEVFIGTSVGLVSYGGDATQGNADFSKLKAYPNPVRETFTGVVTISGLVAETVVKITDISGNLVFETISNGGSVSWDRRNVFGEYVGTGVYMIFCSTKDGAQSGIAKVLVINSKQ